MMMIAVFEPTLPGTAKIDADLWMDLAAALPAFGPRPCVNLNGR